MRHARALCCSRMTASYFHSISAISSPSLSWDQTLIQPNQLAVEAELRSRSRRSASSKDWHGYWERQRLPVTSLEFHLCPRWPQRQNLLLRLAVGSRD